MAPGWAAEKRAAGYPALGWTPEKQAANPRAWAPEMRSAKPRAWARVFRDRLAPQSPQRLRLRRNGRLLQQKTANRLLPLFRAGLTDSQ